MLLRKLKQIKSFLFRQRSAEDSHIAGVATALSTNMSSIGRSAPSGPSFIQRRLNVSRKQYFDSADHFLRIYDAEKSTESKESPKKEAKESSKEPHSILDADATNIPSAPLETAYSEIIDEMKPKEPV